MNPNVWNILELSIIVLFYLMLTSIIQQVNMDIFLTKVANV